MRGEVEENRHGLAMAEMKWSMSSRDITMRHQLTIGKFYKVAGKEVMGINREGNMVVLSC